jgi:hypothetical protein
MSSRPGFRSAIRAPFRSGQGTELHRRTSVLESRGSLVTSGVLVGKLPIFNENVVRHCDSTAC